MRKQILVTIFILLTKLSFSQWQWAKQIGGTTATVGFAVLDANNNIYCTGRFYAPNCYFDTDTLFANGMNDIFLAKYDASGNEQWIKQIGGLNVSLFDTETPCFILIDNTNNFFYFTARFYATVNIDSYSLTSTGGYDILVAKFDLSGNCQWLKKIGSGSDENGATMAFDSNGDIFCAGHLGSNGLVDTFNVTGGGFLTKFDPSGNFLWARNEMTGGYPTSIKIVSNEILT
ncbi:MAG TPA: hypothetical protein VJY62_12245, partial [Bacteroidia bacterium]|nr:hypothetical protein [Bacteroidia bacterium]